MFTAYVKSALLAFAVAATAAKAAPATPAIEERAALPKGVQLIHVDTSNYFQETYDELNLRELLNVPSCTPGPNVTIVQGYDGGPGISYLNYSQSAGPAYNWEFIWDITYYNGNVSQLPNVPEYFSGNAIRAPPTGCNPPPEGIRVFAQNQYKTFDAHRFNYGIQYNTSALNNCVLKGVKADSTDENPTVSAPLGNNGQILPPLVPNGGPYQWTAPTGQDAGLWQGLQHLTIKCDGDFQIGIDDFQYFTPAPTYP